MSVKKYKKYEKPKVIKQAEKKPNEQTHTFDPMGGKKKWIKKDGDK